MPPRWTRRSCLGERARHSNSRARGCGGRRGHGERASGVSKGRNRHCCARGGLRRWQPPLLLICYTSREHLSAAVRRRWARNLRPPGPVDDVRNGTTSHRASPGLLVDGHQGPRGVSGYVERQMPRASSIRWTPTGEAARGDPPFSIFITQRALVAVHDHLVAGPTKCGFLTGGLLHCPETEQPYVLIDSTIWLPGLNVGHDAKRLIAQGWSLADEELRATRRHLVGWYNGHPAAGTTLSRSDADAHLTFFDRPWHVALVVASGDDPTGGFFCRTTSQEWASEHLPFYEVLDGEAPPPDTPKTTVVSWRNYRTEEEVIAASDVALVAGQGTQTRVLFPDEFDEEPVPTSPQQLHRFRRVARYGL